MERRCDTCAYWHPRPEVGEECVVRRGGEHGPVMVGRGDCRIGPPEANGLNGRGRWPLTLADEFCHAHYPKDAPEDDGCD